MRLLGDPLPKLATVRRFLPTDCPWGHAASLGCPSGPSGQGTGRSSWWPRRAMPSQRT